jgi:hypothetical protein
MLYIESIYFHSMVRATTLRDQPSSGAALDMRERLAIPQPALPEALARLETTPGHTEGLSVLWSSGSKNRQNAIN